LLEKVKSIFGANLEDKRFVLWGLAFKLNADDMREAPSSLILSPLALR
jgi:UDP-glucose 6-dehydrogenase